MRRERKDFLLDQHLRFLLPPWKECKVTTSGKCGEKNVALGETAQTERFQTSSKEKQVRLDMKKKKTLQHRNGCQVHNTGTVVRFENSESTTYKTPIKQHGKYSFLDVRGFQLAHDSAFFGRYGVW